MTAQERRDSLLLSLVFDRWVKRFVAWVRHRLHCFIDMFAATLLIWHCMLCFAFVCIAWLCFALLALLCFALLTSRGKSNQSSMSSDGSVQLALLTNRVILRVIAYLELRIRSTKRKLLEATSSLSTLCFTDEW